MASKPKLPSRKGQPTQTTERGLAIPVPKRRDFMGNLRKVAKPSADRKSRTK